MKKILLTIGLLLIFTFANCQLAGIISSEDVPSGPSGFPQILAGTQSGETASATTHVITMPDGVQNGNLILVFFAIDGDETITIAGASSSGWTIESQLGIDDVLDVSGAVVWCIMDETENLTLTTTAEAGTHVSYRISGFKTANPLTVTNVAVGNNNNYDPPDNTGEYGAVNYLWFVFAAADNQDGDNVATVAPSDFGGLITVTGTTTAVASSSVAYREYNTAAAYNPGTFTAASSSDYICFTIIVNPI